MRDFGYGVSTNFQDLSFEEKIPLLEAAYHPPDGINEHGVVVGLANVRPLDYAPDLNKESIWITILVREILDHARDVNEAAAIANQYNICCPTSTSLGIHVLVADPTGHSIILELYNGELQVIPNSESWQVLTNSPVFNLSIEQQIDACGRYRAVYEALESANGNIDQEEGMNILQSVGNPFTQWSAMYNMSDRSIALVLDYQFNKVFHFSLMEL
jgi:penicillin V acylase-like amidase (Ntn superfamily)